MSNIDTGFSNLHDSTDAALGQWLVFRVSAQEYGVNILKVQELRGYEPQQVTRIINAPPFVKGMINLRGQIIPVMDLSQQLTGKPVDVTEHTIIIILSFGARMAGMIVDGVSDVIQLAPEQIKEARSHPGIHYSEYVIGLADRDQSLIQLLDLESVVSQKVIGQTEPSILDQGETL